MTRLTWVISVLFWNEFLVWWGVLFVFCFGTTPCGFRTYSGQGSRDLMGCQGPTLGQPCVRQAPCSLCWHPGPSRMKVGLGPLCKVPAQQVLHLLLFPILFQAKVEAKNQEFQRTLQKGQLLCFFFYPSLLSYFAFLVIKGLLACFS